MRGPLHYQSGATAAKLKEMDEATAAAKKQAEQAATDLSGYMPKAGGTYTGPVYAGVGQQDPNTALVRNIKLVYEEATPENEGEIFFVLG